MKLTRFIILSLVDMCMAQRWKLDRGCDHWGAANKTKIEVAFREAVTMAGTALDVLNKNSGDQKVQKMVKHIFGDDEKLVKEAKEILWNVMGYDKKENPKLDSPSWRNTDLILFCDNSNYEERPTEAVNKIFNLGIPDGSEEKKQHDICFAANPPWGNGRVIALTYRLEDVHQKKYEAALDEWKKKGSQGTPPSERDYSVPHQDKPNTMDLCTWYLRDVFTNVRFVTVDDASIARVQQKSFLDTLSKDDAAVSKLVQSLAGTLLHELTHTYLGGRTRDFAYGWVDIGKSKLGNNADSIAHLGVCMHLFKKGYWVDDDGKVQKIQK